MRYLVLSDYYVCVHVFVLNIDKMTLECYHLFVNIVSGFSREREREGSEKMVEIREGGWVGV